MPMKKLLFLSALVVMGFACVGCTTNDTTSDTPIESTTPGTNSATDNSTAPGTDNATGNNTTNMNNGTGTGDTLNNNGVSNGDGLNDAGNTDNAANGVVTDENGIINDGDTNVQ